MSDPSDHDRAAAPRPTAWPMATAGGVTLLGWGLITSPVLLAIGAALLAWALAGWMGDIAHDGR